MIGEPSGREVRQCSGVVFLSLDDRNIRFVPDSFITQVLSARQSYVQIPCLSGPGLFFGIGPTVVEPALLPGTFNFSRVSRRLKSWGESGGERKC